MAKTKPFDKSVAARTRAAVQILSNPELLKLYIRKGGKKSDLEKIRNQGLAAEAANKGQATAMHGGKGATAELLVEFNGLQSEYSEVMDAAVGVLTDLEEDDGKPADIAKLESIIKNEAQVSVIVTDTETGKQKKVTRSGSQEAVRAEIEKDAHELAGFGAIKTLLVDRGVTSARLTALEKAAQKLAGMLGERTGKKGAAKDATKEETVSVAAQRKRWGGVYRILRKAGAENAQIKALLVEAAR